MLGAPLNTYNSSSIAMYFGLKFLNRWDKNSRTKFKKLPYWKQAYRGLWTKLLDRRSDPHRVYTGIEECEKMYLPVPSSESDKPLQEWDSFDTQPSITLSDPQPPLGWESLSIAKGKWKENIPLHLRLPLTPYQTGVASSSYLSHVKRLSVKFRDENVSMEVIGKSLYSEHESTYSFWDRNLEGKPRSVDWFTWAPYVKGPRKKKGSRSPKVSSPSVAPSSATLRIRRYLY